MRVLVAPDKFAGTLTATEAAHAIADGWHRTAPGDEIELVPLSDGGPGFLEVMYAGLGGHLHAVTVGGPLGDPVDARILLTHDGQVPTAYVEAASASGLHLVPPERRDPLAASSAGLGTLLIEAEDSGVARIVVGVGGTASTDGGAGMLAALGATPRDLLVHGGGAFAERSRNADEDPHDSGVSAALGVDLAPARHALAGVELVAATDVDAPLLGGSGAAHGFGAQKGADRAARELLENAMRTWAGATDGGLAVKAGTGAGGGIGFGLMLLGATRVPGAQLALDATGLVERARHADLLVTGEGAFDWQSLRGKVVAGVARTGQETGRPTVVLAGRVEVGRRELANAGIDAAYAVDGTPRRSPDQADADRGAGRDQRPNGDPGSESGHSPAEELSALAERVARSWSR